MQSLRTEIADLQDRLHTEESQEEVEAEDPGPNNVLQETEADNPTMEVDPRPETLLLNQHQSQNSKTTDSASKTRNIQKKCSVKTPPTRRQAGPSSKRVRIAHVSRQEDLEDNASVSTSHIDAGCAADITLSLSQDNEQIDPPTSSRKRPSSRSITATRTCSSIREQSRISSPDNKEESIATFKKSSKCTVASNHPHPDEEEELETLSTSSFPRVFGKFIDRLESVTSRLESSSLPETPTKMRKSSASPYKTPKEPTPRSTIKNQLMVKDSQYLLSD
jgi:hypothetical protein